MEVGFVYEDNISHSMISHLIISIKCVKLNTFIRVFIEIDIFIILHSHWLVRIGNIYLGSFVISLTFHISFLSICHHIY